MVTQPAGQGLASQGSLPQFLEKGRKTCLAMAVMVKGESRSSGKTMVTRQVPGQDRKVSQQSRIRSGSNQGCSQPGDHWTDSQ